MRILVDADVVMDVLANRQPFYQNSSRILMAIESGSCEGFLAAHTFTTIYYLVAKSANRTVAGEAVRKLLHLFRVAPVSDETLKLAIGMDATDFEDAAQMACALQIGADRIVTRNLGDYSNAPVPAVSPVQWLASRGDALDSNA